ncbi:receptor-like protein kinase HSL1 [Phalaenopsis equestris]|uniref:receptor-like protein kinase HSL1 n=1 Tax=Phalaenopsis equestris TaxID=78828 RepID=UPI0009E2A4A6|nr:receptor-like protein kinase HSL1 [Phalaenopsis equestris]
MAGKHRLQSASFLSLLLFLSSVALPHSKSQPISNEEEKRTLLLIKRDLGNPPSLDPWNNSTSTSHCNWTGIQCNSHGSVSRIFLQNQNLAGQLPPSICDLKNLTSLNLYNNSISGSFPTFLYNCSNLQYLNLAENLFVRNLPDDIHRLSPRLTDLVLSANNFTGDIPTSIGQLPSIQNLYLAYNLFNGILPSEIGNLTTLEMLWLENNPFPSTTTIPPKFGNLTRLTGLLMRQANLGGEIPESLGKLAALQELDLSINSLSGRIPDGIWALETLRFLFLYKNQLSGGINGTAIKALSIESIDVSQNQLTGRIPDEFGGMKQLSILLMYFNRFSGEIPSGIGLLPSLSDLRLFNNILAGGLPPELGKHSPLWNVEVDDNLLSGEIPSDLCAQKALVSVILFNNNFSGNLPASLSKCFTLSNIMIYRNNLSGEFPAGIWTTAVNLTTVMMGDNSLTGTLPDALPWNLTRLEIQNNQFVGNLPSTAKNLIVFNANNNLLFGSIPLNLSSLPQLAILSLGSNQISGSIPPEIFNLRFLTDLNLSSNHLVGEIPSSIGTLPVLTSLDLSNNQLSGAIPSSIGGLRLNLLNLSSNELSGEIPITLQSKAYAQSFISNPGLCSSNSDLHVSPCKLISEGSNGHARGFHTLIAILVALVLIAAALFAFFVARDCRRRRSTDINQDWKMTPFQLLDFTEESIIRGLREENLVGTGGSGKVYRVAVGFRSGGAVAVKKMWSGRKMDWKLQREFEAELRILGSIRHINVLRLLCCVSGACEKLLVYEYMENGSLARWLHGGYRELDWPARLGIAVGAARGLSYMHHECSPPVLHRDVKSSNILLDSQLRPKIADFGLARMMVQPGELQSTSMIVGSFGYMAPECGNANKVNEKVDVYSFGVVLLELITGREASDGGEYGGLAEWARCHFQKGDKMMDAVDERIRDPVHLDELRIVFKLAIICTATMPSTRPTMKDVLQILLRCDRMGRSDETLGSERDYDVLLQSKTSIRRNKSKSIFEVEDLVNIV